MYWSVNTEERTPNPWTNANILEIFTFSWILKLFKEGRNKDLEIDDLYIIPDVFSSSLLGNELEKKWRAEMENEKKTNGKPSLLRVFIKMYGFKFMLYGLNILLATILIRMPLPELIGKLLAYFNHDKSDPVELKDAYLYALSIVLRILVSTVLLHNTMVEVQQYGMKMRVACSSLIFKKFRDLADRFAVKNQNVIMAHLKSFVIRGLMANLKIPQLGLVLSNDFRYYTEIENTSKDNNILNVLRLSKNSIDEITAGQIVNLLSNDVQRFDIASKAVNFIWTGPLIAIIVTYFMWQAIGVSAIIGMAALIMFIPIQIWLGQKSSQYRLQTAHKTDHRIKLMNEIISGILVIKMYTWEKPFSKLVQYSRQMEIEKIKRNTYIKLILQSFKIFQTRFALLVGILSYILLGNHISIQIVFVIISYYNLLVIPMATLFPASIGSIADMLVSIKRIQSFLLYTEKDQQIASFLQEEKTLNNSEKTSVVNLENNVTHDTDSSIKIEKPDDIGIDISNASAKWIFNQADETLKNINLIIRPGQVVAVIGPVGAGKSSLIHLILRELPISEGSISVRGVVSYASQEPWLFNSSVQQNILFDSIMNNERYKKVIEICALVPDLKQLPYGDKTIVGENGVSLSGGQKARINLARAIYKQADIYLLDDPLSAVDTNVGKHLFEKCIKDYLKEKICVFVTHQIQYLGSIDQIVLLNNANIVAEGNYHKLLSSEIDLGKFFGSSDASIQTFDNKSCGVNNKVNLNTEHFPTLENSVKHFSSSIYDSKLIREQVEPIRVTETRAYGNVSRNVYFSYISAAGNMYKILFLLLTFISTQILCSAGDYWISYWADLEDHVFHNSTVLNDKQSNVLLWWSISSYTCAIVFAILCISMVILVCIRSYVYTSVLMDISINLHNNMFNSIAGATMYFFNSNTSGIILNRFVYDMETIDEALTTPIGDLIHSLCVLFGLIFIVGLIRIYLLAPLIIIGALFYYTTIFYLSLSRSLKRLEGISRSSVLTHLNTSIRGLTTIRSFKAETTLSIEFDKHLDLYSSAWFSYIWSSQAFGFAMDMIVFLLVTILIFSFLLIYNDTESGNIGLVITQSMSLAGVLQWGVRQLSEIENQMTSVERVLEYTNVSQELTFKPSPDKRLLRNWPNRGKIEFKNFNLRYSPYEPYILKNINIKVQPMEKIGIVGRTGAGKSSLIKALFRLAHNEGNIIIDDVDIHKLGLHDLRSKISIIPQEPVLFSGTMRKNLDPFEEYTDHALWNTLEEIKLRPLVEALPDGLNSKVSDDGSNFSVGQKQLMCLARAVLRDNKILILDEATANVDLQTDVLIQNTIRKKFRARTVLTIAHRLNTVMDSDKILVMDSGKVVEFDHPYILLKNRDGVFYKMVERTGRVTADFLHGVASENYKVMSMAQES